MSAYHDDKFQRTPAEFISSTATQQFANDWEIAPSTYKHLLWHLNCIQLQIPTNNNRTMIHSDNVICLSVIVKHMTTHINCNVEETLNCCQGTLKKKCPFDKSPTWCYSLHGLCIACWFQHLSHVVALVGVGTEVNIQTVEQQNKTIDPYRIINKKNADNREYNTSESSNSCSVDIQHRLTSEQTLVKLYSGCNPISLQHHDYKLSLRPIAQEYATRVRLIIEHAFTVGRAVKNTSNRNNIQTQSTNSVVSSIMNIESHGKKSIGCIVRHIAPEQDEIKQKLILYYDLDCAPFICFDVQTYTTLNF